MRGEFNRMGIKYIFIFLKTKLLWKSFSKSVFLGPTNKDNSKNFFWDQWSMIDVYGFGLTVVILTVKCYFKVSLLITNIQWECITRKPVKSGAKLLQETFVLFI